MRKVIKIKRWKVAIDSFGIEFPWIISDPKKLVPYVVETVVWLWPWKRKSGFKFISLSFESGFKSLEELNETWVDYFKAYGFADDEIMFRETC